MDRLNARAEEASFNAWPALKEIFYDGWLIRLAGGETRRTNSVNVIGESRAALDTKLARCSAIYADHGLPVYFRLRSDDVSGLDAALAARGFASEDTTLTLFKPFEGVRPAADPKAVLRAGRPGQAWLDAHASFTGRERAATRMRERLIDLIAVPAAFAACRGSDGRIGAVAYGALHDGLVSLQWVATDPALRGQGLAGRVIEALFIWAVERGAGGACLQVMADNRSALRLYARMGFAQELYRYHYRVR